MPASPLRRPTRSRRAHTALPLRTMTTRRSTALNRASKPRAAPSRVTLDNLRGKITKPRTAPIKSPKCLNPTVTESCPSPAEERLPTSPLSDTCIATSPALETPPTKHAAHLALSAEPSGAPVGRQDKFDQVYSLLSTTLDRSRPSASVYVCGTPGTGKTLTVSNVLRKLHAAPSSSDEDTELVDLVSCDESEAEAPQGSEHSDTFSSLGRGGHVWVNCAHLSSPRDLFSEVAQKLKLPSVASGDAAKSAIRSFAQSAGPRVTIVLDEVDFLSSRDQLVLYAAFEWPHLPSSRIALVGIANAIDLPVRLLPWLRANRCMPTVVQFAPYNAAALTAIVRQRLENASSPSLSTVAVSLAAKKVAAGSGDARLVLDVCREAEVALQRGESGSLKAISIVSEILNRRGGLSAAVEVIKQLPVQQQLALCVAANAIVFGDEGPLAPSQGKRVLNQKATLGGLYESFTRMCTRTRVQGVSFSEFADICSNALMHHGLLEVGGGRGGRGKGGGKTLRSKAVRLRVPIEDVRAGVAERGFLSLVIVR